MEAHILVCFLALALWRTLEMWRRGKGLGTCARRLIEEVATIKSLLARPPASLFPSSSSVVLPVKRGSERATLRVRCVARPDRRVSELLVRLGLELPTRSRSVEDVTLPADGNVVQKPEA